ncbi:MAG: transposase [Candidatus Hydrogenedentes bacterium]|nr:transposase [Candidatus Hydrogenedentota bacterium]
MEEFPDIVYPKNSCDASKRGRKALPHWELEGGCYSVTFRLADSLARTVLESFIQEREALANALRMKGALTSVEEQSLARAMNEKVESWLDAGRGRCYLKRPEIAAVVAHALVVFHGERHRLLAWCVMPNHVHAVVQPLEGFSLEQVTHSWKSYTAHSCNRLLGRTGAFWHRESYDHLIRNVQELEHAVEYALSNPERAGLKGWPWRGLMKEMELRPGLEPWPTPIRRY